MSLPYLKLVLTWIKEWTLNWRVMNSRIYFINTMYCMNLVPKVTRSTRITSHCATLIDNIFTNDTENKTVSALLINDISDHLPVFTVCDRNYKIKNMDRKKVHTKYWPALYNVGLHHHWTWDNRGKTGYLDRKKSLFNAPHSCCFGNS